MLGDVGGCGAIVDEVGGGGAMVVVVVVDVGGAVVGTGGVSVACSTKVTVPSAMIISYVVQSGGALSIPSPMTTVSPSGLTYCIPVRYSGYSGMVPTEVTSPLVAPNNSSWVKPAAARIVTRCSEPAGKNWIVPISS